MSSPKVLLNFYRFQAKRAEPSLVDKEDTGHSFHFPLQPSSAREPRTKLAHIISIALRAGQIFAGAKRWDDDTRQAVRIP
jgi:hypothetical protein